MNFILLIVCSLVESCICNDDFVSLEKIPLQDISVIRDERENAPMTNLVTENPFRGGNDSKEFAWLEDAVKDIAYYLRSHKFNEYDRRYESKPEKAPRDYFGSFPRPPLRSLHWEVHKFCEPSFLGCMDYLRKKVAGTGLKRVDDTSVAVQEQQWNASENQMQIQEVDFECKKMLQSDDQRADPFLGPIERYQWRVTASYYMCWFTMNEVPDLKHFEENCDNFANCLDTKYGPNNFDVRAKDDEPFKCALYSFCPDPCCPTLKHMTDTAEYWSCTDNPCYGINPEGKRDCLLHRSENANFHDLILNRWNVTCHCPDAGYKWSSQYGICIDVDECLATEHNCKNDSELCVNLPGSFYCACRWGYAWTGGACKVHGAVETIKLEKKLETAEAENKMAKSLVRRLFDFITESIAALRRYSS